MKTLNVTLPFLNFLGTMLRETPEGASGAVDGKEGTPPVDGEGTPPEGAGENKSLINADPKEGEGGTTDDDGGDASEPLTSESFTVPEDVEIPKEAMSSFVEIMNNAEMSAAERGQALLDLQVETMKGLTDAAAEAGQKLWNDTQTEWQEAAKALPEIGGDKLPQTLATIKKGLEQVGADAETFKAFDLTGAGNNPHIIKVLHGLTKNLVEGGHVSGAPVRGTLDRATKMFGGTTEN